MHRAPHDTLPKPLDGEVSGSSARWLLSTSYHEVTHIQQAAQYNWGAKGTPLYCLNEVESYAAELSVSGSLGLSSSQVIDIQSRWLGCFDMLSPSVQQGALNGIYSVP